MSAVAFSEIAFDAVLFWRLALPALQQLPAKRKAMPSTLLTAEKIGVAAGGLLAVVILLVSIIVSLRTATP